MCALVDGPVRDFNLMVRRGRARGAVVVLRAVKRRCRPATSYVCYAAKGASEAWWPAIRRFRCMRITRCWSPMMPAASVPGLHVNPLAPGAIVLAAVIEVA